MLFCNKLSELDGLDPCYDIPEPFANDDDWAKKVKWKKDANGYRLPTEAEWEYCARAGQATMYSGGDDMDEVGWYDENSGNKTHPVGLKKANGYGLYDMSGNVKELCWDGRGEYEESKIVDPTGDTSSSVRVLRGGNWRRLAGYCRVAYRSSFSPSNRDYDRGVRFFRTKK